MSSKLLPHDQILELLSATLDQIAMMTKELTESQIRARPQGDQWSISEVFAHMRASADMWGEGRIRTMLTEDHPTIRTMSPLTWIKQTDYLDQVMISSLAAFRKQRQEVLTLLEPLSDEGWSRSATITGAGRLFEVTVHIEGDALARHDRLDVKQIRKTANMFGK